MSKPTKICKDCFEEKVKDAFSATQWKKASGSGRCKRCVNAKSSPPQTSPPKASGANSSSSANGLTFKFVSKPVTVDYKTVTAKRASDAICTSCDVRDTHTPGENPLPPRCAYCGKEATMKCGRCGLVCYDDQECQRADFNRHARECTQPRTAKLRKRTKRVLGMPDTLWERIASFCGVQTCLALACACRRLAVAVGRNERVWRHHVHELAGVGMPMPLKSARMFTEKEFVVQLIKKGFILFDFPVYTHLYNRADKTFAMIGPNTVHTAFHMAPDASFLAFVRRRDGTEQRLHVPLPQAIVWSPQFGCRRLRENVPKHYVEVEAPKRDETVVSAAAFNPRTGEPVFVRTSTSTAASRRRLELVVNDQIVAECVVPSALSKPAKSFQPLPYEVLGMSVAPSGRRVVIVLMSRLFLIDLNESRVVSAVDSPFQLLNSFWEDNRVTHNFQRVSVHMLDDTRFLVWEATRLVLWHFNESNRRLVPATAMQSQRRGFGLEPAGCSVSGLPTPTFAAVPVRPRARADKDDDHLLVHTIGCAAFQARVAVLKRDGSVRQCAELTIDAKWLDNTTYAATVLTECAFPTATQMDGDANAEASVSTYDGDLACVASQMQVLAYADELTMAGCALSCEIGTFDECCGLIRDVALSGNGRVAAVLLTHAVCFFDLGDEAARTAKSDAIAPFRIVRFERAKTLNAVIFSSVALRHDGRTCVLSTLDLGLVQTDTDAADMLTYGSERVRLLATGVDDRRLFALAPQVAQRTSTADAEAVGVHKDRNVAFRVCWAPELEGDASRCTSCGEIRGVGARLIGNEEEIAKEVRVIEHMEELVDGIDELSVLSDVDDDSYDDDEYEDDEDDRYYDSYDSEEDYYDDDEDMYARDIMSMLLHGVPYGGGMYMAGPCPDCGDYH